MVTIELAESLYDLAGQYPALADILTAVGFRYIQNKRMLNTLGRILTISGGALVCGIDVVAVIAALHQHGFEISGKMQAYAPPAQGDTAAQALQGAEVEKSVKLFKAFLSRLHSGEAPELVQADFADSFADVEDSILYAAEREIIRDDTPISDVKIISELQVALYSSNAQGSGQDVAPLAAVAPEPPAPQVPYSEKMSAAAELIEIEGHPLQTFTKENEALAIIIKAVQKQVQRGKVLFELTKKLSDIALHYSKKGDLLYPLLRENYGILGPSEVMWTNDDEIRVELRALLSVSSYSEEELARMEALLKRVQDMIYQETNILFPICAVNFTQSEWCGIYQDAKDYDICFGVVPREWQKGESYYLHHKAPMGDIRIGGGSFTVEQLSAVLNTLPVEITFVDNADINRYFNEGHKIFKRPKMALGRSVFSCHPPRLEKAVAQVLSDFRSGKRDVVTQWSRQGDKTIRVRYLAVRGSHGEYLGTLELVEDMEEAKHFFCDEK